MEKQYKKPPILSYKNIPNPEMYNSWKKMPSDDAIFSNKTMSLRSFSPCYVKGMQTFSSIHATDSPSGVIEACTSWIIVASVLTRLIGMFAYRHLQAFTKMWTDA